MQCSRCYSKFKYIDIPMENRIYEAGSARFICPCGRVWLKPRRKFAFVSVLGLLAIAVPVVIGSFGRIFGFHFDSEDNVISFISIVVGIIIFLFSVFTVELQVVDEVPEISEPD